MRKNLLRINCVQIFYWVHDQIEAHVWWNNYTVYAFWLLQKWISIKYSFGIRDIFKKNDEELYLLVQVPFVL